MDINSMMELRRKVLLEREIKKLEAQYRRTKAEIYLIKLQALGVDCDLIPGYDDGEGIGQS